MIGSILGDHQTFCERLIEPGGLVVGDIGLLVDTTADAVACEIGAHRISLGEDGCLDGASDVVDRNACACCRERAVERCGRAGELLGGAGRVADWD